MRLRYALLPLLCLYFFGCSGVLHSLSSDNGNKPLAEPVEPLRIADNTVFYGIETLPELSEDDVFTINLPVGNITKVLKTVTTPPPKWWPLGDAIWYAGPGH